MGTRLSSWITTQNEPLGQYHVQFGLNSGQNDTDSTQKPFVPHFQCLSVAVTLFPGRCPGLTSCAPSARRPILSWVVGSLLRRGTLGGQTKSSQDVLKEVAL